MIAKRAWRGGRQRRESPRRTLRRTKALLDCQPDAGCGRHWRAARGFSSPLPTAFPACLLWLQLEVCRLDDYPTDLTARMGAARGATTPSKDCRGSVGARRPRLERGLLARPTCLRVAFGPPSATLRRGSNLILDLIVFGVGTQIETLRTHRLWARHRAETCSKTAQETANLSARFSKGHSPSRGGHIFPVLPCPLGQPQVPPRPPRGR